MSRASSCPRTQRLGALSPAYARTPAAPVALRAHGGAVPHGRFGRPSPAGPEGAAPAAAVAAKPAPLQAGLVAAIAAALALSTPLPAGAQASPSRPAPAPAPALVHSLADTSGLAAGPPPAAAPDLRAAGEPAPPPPPPPLVMAPMDATLAPPPARAPPARPAPGGPGLTPGELLLDEGRIAEVYRRLPPPPAGAPPLPDIVVPDIRRLTLPNGLRVLLLRDEEVPLVRGGLLIAGGQAASPGDKVGLASITAAVQRAGGSLQHPGAALDDRLEGLAAGIEAAAGPRAISVEFECASEDASEVLSLLSEVVTSPVFPEDKLDVTKGQVLESLSHKNDVGSSVARRELRKLVLGADSPWARTPTTAGVKSISREDLQAFWATWERPDSSVLGIVGDFEPSAMEASIRSAFGPWSPAPGQPPAPPRAASGAGGGSGAPGGGGEGVVWLVDRPGAAQASVAAGEPGVSLFDADAFALSALNSSLNGFGGSLFDTLRTQEGLCYSVSGGWELPFDHEGMFIASGETSQPAPFLKGLQRVLGVSAEAAPPADRLERAKREKLNSFVFNFSTYSAQLQRAAAYELLGIPQDFLYTYRAGIEAVSPSDVLCAASAHLHPRRQAAVVVADAASARPALEAAGFEVRPLALDDN